MNCSCTASSTCTYLFNQLLHTFIQSEDTTWHHNTILPRVALQADILISLIGVDLGHLHIPNFQWSPITWSFISLPTRGARHAVHLVAERPSNKRSWQRFDFCRSAITELNLLKLWQVLHPKKFELWAPCLEISSLKARHFQLWSPIHLFACIFCWNYYRIRHQAFCDLSSRSQKIGKGCHSEFILAPESPEKAGYLRMFWAQVAACCASLSWLFLTLSGRSWMLCVPRRQKSLLGCH